MKIKYTVTQYTSIVTAMGARRGGGGASVGRLAPWKIKSF